MLFLRHVLQYKNYERAIEANREEHLRSARGVIVSVTLAKAAVGLAGRGETAGLATLVDSLSDPVDAGIAADSLVEGVNADDLVVLVDAVLVDPVALQNMDEYFLGH